jgi:hypothetical protein
MPYTALTFKSATIRGRRLSTPYVPVIVAKFRLSLPDDGIPDAGILRLSISLQELEDIYCSEDCNGNRTYRVGVVPDVHGIEDEFFTSLLAIPVTGARATRIREKLNSNRLRLMAERTENPVQAIRGLGPATVYYDEMINEADQDFIRSMFPSTAPPAGQEQPVYREAPAPFPDSPTGGYIRGERVAVHWNRLGNGLTNIDIPGLDTGDRGLPLLGLSVNVDFPYRTRTISGTVTSTLPLGDPVSYLWTSHCRTKTCRISYSDGFWRADTFRTVAPVSTATETLPGADYPF